ncbi:MAG: RNB domain-containing ribonuclease [Spirochaetaceae bacterium]|jgi:exoribonuclease-2|nr:RNB domain-containing ribonuclease [Spirochaetaceae bacterium]
MSKPETMFKKDALVIYKTRPARIGEIADKITLVLANGETVKVREKDFVFLHPGPLTNFSLLSSPHDAPDSSDQHNDPHSIEEADSKTDACLREAWELLDGSTTTLRELAELAFGDWSPSSAWLAYQALQNGTYFAGTMDAVIPKDAAQVEAEQQKQAAKANEGAERAAFLARLKVRSLLPSDSRFMQDVEALALGRTEKSRTMKDARLSEEPVAAHRLLLETGVWDMFVNPHPARNGCVTESAKTPVLPPDMAEERADLTHLAAFAIDNEGSEDPDDAIGVTEEGGQTVLWVHVADPAASVLPDTPADKEARERGSTLYTPDGVYTMLSPDALPLFALGLQERTPALTFKLTLNPDTTIAAVDILLSLIKVTRLTYREADELLEKGAKGESGDSKESRELAALDQVSQKILERRLNSGAIVFDFPEVVIHVCRGENDSLEKTAEKPVEVDKEENPSDEAPGQKSVDIQMEESYHSQRIVRECMLVSGEGAAQWALRNKIPFPYISQEAGDPPGNLFPGLAGAYQLRRTMRPRTLSNKPGLHWALGLDIYTQVTSPLRRYTDLLCHQQIRAFLKNTPLLTEDEILARLLQAERGASAANHAQRASNTHWKQVYLSGKKGQAWDAILLEKRKPRSIVLIPALAIETQAALSAAADDCEPGDTLKITLLKANVPENEAVWGTT